jgi:5'-deoxynucleotidase YfbR-like HD superfamily hydrolase
LSSMRVWPSNVLIDPLNPDPELIDIRDVAHHLARIFRYGGASDLSVAQHSCEMTLHILNTAFFTGGKVSETHRGYAFECLMHDSAEYLLGDLIRPLKNCSPLGDAFRPIESHVESIIRARFGVTHRYPEKVHELDRMMCATEQRDLFRASPLNCIQGMTIFPWTPSTAEQEFLRLFYLLKPVEQEARVAA